MHDFIVALDAMCGNGLTNCKLDRDRAVMVIKAGESVGMKAEAIELVKLKRENHRQWITLTQRKWQSHFRGMRGAVRRANWQNRALDVPYDTALRCALEGLQTREKYVRTAQ